MDYRVKYQYGYKVYGGVQSISPFFSRLYHCINVVLVLTFFPLSLSFVIPPSSSSLSSFHSAIEKNGSTRYVKVYISSSNSVNLIDSDSQPPSENSSSNAGNNIFLSLPPTFELNRAIFLAPFAFEVYEDPPRIYLDNQEDLNSKWPMYNYTLQDKTKGENISDRSLFDYMNVNNVLLQQAKAKDQIHYNIQKIM